MKTVALVGRTNVGKSTLFNRLTGRRDAIVHDMPGVTRDRREGTAKLSDLTFRVIDTAGLEDISSLSKAMWEQTRKAIEQADVVCAIVDGRSSLNPLDKRLAVELRGLKKPVILLVNKCEGSEQTAQIGDAYSLGLGDPIPVSGAHGLGMADLYTALLPYLEKADTDEIVSEDEDAEKPLKISIVGRPNVGKSTLVNCLLGSERMLTGPEAGVTRDAICVDFAWKGHAIKLTDTAGLRKRGKVNESLEKMSAADTKRALDFAEVVVVVVDATNPLENQDLLIARQTVEEGRALVIAVNKWDKVDNPRQLMTQLKEKLRTGLQQVKGVPVVMLSAKNGTGMDLLMKECFRMYDIWNKRVPTHKLNEWLRRMTEATPPPVAKNGRRIPMRYMTQVGIRPPTFVIFSSNPDELPESYLRYLSNGLRQDYGLDGIPIRISMRKRNNPYADKKK